MSEDLNYSKALLYSHRLFRYRPRSIKELEQRLKQRGFGAPVIDKIIKNFKKQNLLDDKRFANFWALNKIQTKPSSLNRVKKELLFKGIESQIVEDTIGQLKEDFDEYETAKALAEKRLRILSGINRPNPALSKDKHDLRKGGMKAKRRLFDYLKRRGFSSDIVYRIINEVCANWHR